MIGVDWGTSSLRAFRLDSNGRVLDRVSAPRGILHVQGGQFPATLREHVGEWLAAGETRVLIAGMAGSRQGWLEAPYVSCPAGSADIAARLVEVVFDGAKVLLIPGLSELDDNDTPDVIRGEETQILGVLGRLAGEAVACLPGSHSKWARIVSGRITGFATYFSGEIFAALRSATILGRMMTDAPSDLAAFDRGVARAGDPGHLLHQLFGVRTLCLFGALAETASASYLSGLLIGHEIRAAMPPGMRVHLIGSAALCELYARAITSIGGEAVTEDEDAAAHGLAAIGKDASW